MASSTLRDHRPAADICREHDWRVGTCLAGDAGLGSTVIEITSLGERVMLAKIVRHGFRSVDYNEPRDWSLALRDWKQVDRR